MLTLESAPIQWRRTHTARLASPGVTQDSADDQPIVGGPRSGGRRKLARRMGQDTCIRNRGATMNAIARTSRIGSVAAIDAGA